MSNILRKMARRKAGEVHVARARGPARSARPVPPAAPSAPKVRLRSTCKKCHGLGYTGEVEYRGRKVRIGCTCVPDPPEAPKTVEPGE